MASPIKHLDKSDFDILAALAPYCKKSISDILSDSTNPQSVSTAQKEIDFVLLQNQLQTFQDIQRSSCEEIVQIVDDHFDTFCHISQQLETVQDKLSRTDSLYNRLLSQVQEAKLKALNQEGELQGVVEAAEIAQIQIQLLRRWTVHVDFLVKFNQEFETNIKELEWTSITSRQKNLILKFCWKAGTMKRLASHVLLQKSIRQYEPMAILDSLIKQVETYLSDQLTSLIFHNAFNMQAEGVLILCFDRLGKLQAYYQVIQEHLVLSELRVVESELLTHKTSISSGRQEKQLDQFFSNLFTLVKELPDRYPSQRIVKLVNSFLSKKELNFLYIYTLPHFPYAYNSFCQHLNKLLGDKPELINKIQSNHRWNIKMWADVRVQEVFRKFQQKNNNSEDLLKWIQTIFKPSSTIQGTSSKMVKLALTLIARHCATAQTQVCTDEDYPEATNRLVDYLEKLPLKLRECLLESTRGGLSQQLISKLTQETSNKLSTATHQFLGNHLKFVVNSCISAFENVNSILSKVLAGKELSHSKQSLFRSLHSHIRNQPTLSSAAKQAVESFVIEEVRKRYLVLREEIREACKRTLTLQQARKVEEYFKNQQSKLFS